MNHLTDLKRRYSKEIAGISIKQAIIETVADSGFTAFQLTSSGRCFEFQEALIQRLEQNGYKPVAVDSRSWNRSVRAKLGFEETDKEWQVLEDHMHAWVYCKGRHYDSETPDGVKQPLELPFFHRYI